MDADIELAICVISIAALLIGVLIGFGIGRASGEAQRHNQSEKIKALAWELNDKQSMLWRMLVERELRERK